MLDNTQKVHLIDPFLMPLNTRMQNREKPISKPKNTYSSFSNFQNTWICDIIEIQSFNKFPQKLH